MSDVENRVAAGVEWLDANYPDWRSKVDVNEFDIESSCACVLGQLFEPVAVHSGFEYALNNKILTVEECTARGFDATPDDTTDDFRELQREWTRVLSQKEN